MNKKKGKEINIQKQYKHNVSVHWNGRTHSSGQIDKTLHRTIEISHFAFKALLELHSQRALGFITLQKPNHGSRNESCCTRGDTGTAQSKKQPIVKLFESLNLPSAVPVQYYTYWAHALSLFPDPSPKPDCNPKPRQIMCHQNSPWTIAQKKSCQDWKIP